MKITHKLAALATAAVMALSFTGCDGLGELLQTFGKDDFRGTWVADYIDQNNRQVAVVNIFDGKSENIATEGVFVQSKIRFAANANNAHTSTGEDDEILDGAYVGGTPAMRNFYYGTYELNDNSNYTAGRLSLTYKYGIQWNGGEEVDIYFYNEDKTKDTTKGCKTYTITQLTDIAFGKKGKDNENNEIGLTLAGTNDGVTYNSGEEFFAAHFPASTSGASSTKADPTVEVTFGKNNGSSKELYGDIEHFSFALADATTTGYSSMVATEWWSVDQVRFSKYATKEATTPSEGWYYDYTEITGNTKTLTGKFGGGTRDVTFLAPGKTSRGSVKNHGTGPFDKNYWSAAMCDWEVPKNAENATRTYGQISTKVDMDLAIDFVEGKTTDKKNRVIDYTVNTAVKDSETDAWDYDTAEDDYNVRSVADEAAIYASPALVESVGEHVEK